MISVVAGCGKLAADDHELETENVMETEAETEAATEEPETAGMTEAVAEQPAEPETPVVVQTTMFAQKKVNVRQAPDTNSAILGTLSVNDPVIVNGEQSAEGWYTVTYCDQTAYVKGDLLGTGTVAVSTSTSTAGTGKKTGGKASSAGTAGSSSSEPATSTPASTDGSTGVAQREQTAQSQPEQPTPQPAAQSEPTPQPAPDTSGNAGQTEGINPDQVLDNVNSLEFLPSPF